MNVLLIGGSGSLMNHMIIKLKKEGHQVYLLTGNRKKDTSYEKVFESYLFPYDSDNLHEIFESVNPDVTLFMGAFDSNFNWEEDKKESVRYTSSMLNILVAYTMEHKGRFVYLSSNEVYQNDYENQIKEETSYSATHFKGMALIQAEEICKNYQRGCALDIVILRLDNLYQIPKNRQETDNVCADMCIQAIKSGVITVNEGREFSLLYESDAVEFIYQIMSCRNHKEYIYNLSSGKQINEKQLSEMIQACMKTEVTIKEEKKTNNRILLDNKRFDEEFGIRIFSEIKDTVFEVVKHIEANKDFFINQNDNKESWYQKLKKQTNWFVKAAIPFVENIICFILFFILNNKVAENEFFQNIDFYLLYVLLFAIIYGQQQATFSAILAIGGYFFKEKYSRSGFEIALDYNTYIWITELFILGLVVGYMRDQIRNIRMERVEERAYLEKQVEDMQDINSSNVRVKDALERQIIDQKDSIGKIYSITSTLDQYMPDEVLFYAVEMLKELIGSEDVAIYTVVNGDYARMFSASSKKARQLGNSVRYREMTDMYEAIEQRKVFINRKLDEKYPLMANAIFEEEKMQMILMVWGIPWERMTLSQANLLVVVSYLIQNAVLRANRYMGALEEQRYMEDTNILEPEAFQSLVTAYMNAKVKNLTECTILCVEVEGRDYEDVGKVLGGKLRQSDYMGALEDGNMYILLANTSKESAIPVIERFVSAGYQCRIVEKIKT